MRSAPSPRRGVLALAAVSAPALLATLPGVAAAVPAIAADAVCVKPVKPPTGPLVAPPLTLTGSGFTPGGQVQIALGGRTQFTTANPDGTLSYPADTLGLLVSLRSPRAVPFTVTATDATQGVSNSLALFSAPLRVTLSPTRGRPTDRGTYGLSGFTPGKAIYAHWRLRGVLKANTRFGVAKGPCGTLVRKRIRFDVRNPQAGRWIVQFDHSRKFYPRISPRVVLERTVTRTPAR